MRIRVKESGSRHRNKRFTRAGAASHKHRPCRIYSVDLLLFATKPGLRCFSTSLSTLSLLFASAVICASLFLSPPRFPRRCSVSRRCRRRILASASRPPHKKKSSPCASVEAVGNAWKKHKKRKRNCASCIVPSLLKLPTFHAASTLQLQIDQIWRRVTPASRLFRYPSSFLLDYL